MFMFRLVTILFAQLCLGGVRVASLCDGRLCHVQLILTYNISCVSLSDHMKLSTKCWLEVLFVLSLVLSSSLVFSSFRSIYLNIWLLNFLHCLLGCCQDLEVTSTPTILGLLIVSCMVCSLYVCVFILDWFELYWIEVYGLFSVAEVL